MSLKLRTLKIDNIQAIFLIINASESRQENNDAFQKSFQSVFRWLGMETETNNWTQKLTLVYYHRHMKVKYFPETACTKNCKEESFEELKKSILEIGNLKCHCFHNTKDLTSNPEKQLIFSKQLAII